RAASALVPFGRSRGYGERVADATVHRLSPIRLASSRTVPIRRYPTNPRGALMQVLLPDGQRLDVPERATGADVAAALGPGLARAALGVRVDGALSDLQSQVPDGARIEVVTKKDADAIRLMRHTLAHVMAQAVREMFVRQGHDPNQVRMGIGPVIEHGFYYDFD